MNIHQFIYIFSAWQILRMRKIIPLFALRYYVTPSIDNIWNNTYVISPDCTIFIIWY